jgi:hypothetical protein
MGDVYFNGFYPFIDAAPNGIAGGAKFALDVTPPSPRFSFLS